MKNFKRFSILLLLLINMSAIMGLKFSSFSPTKTLSLKGNARGEVFGSSVSGAGDIDNDGYDDIIIGAPSKNNNQRAIYVIYGGEGSGMSDTDLSMVTLNPSTTGFMITGSEIFDFFGASVSIAGDIDNDGYDDIIISSVGYKNSQGAVYVIYGGPKASRANIDLSTQTLDPLTTGFLIEGSAAYDGVGTAVSSAGDINKDGYDDILIGADSFNDYKGAAFLIYGGPRASMSNIVLSVETLNPRTTGFTILGGVADGLFGTSVSSAGDIDKDGYDDFIVGTPFENCNRGAGYVIYGGPKSSMSHIDLSSTVLDPLTTGFMITGSTAFENLGRSVSRAGDLNRDGYADIILGATKLTPNPGVAYIIYGGPRSSRSHIVLSSTILDPKTTGFKITGAAANQNFGGSVNSAGDLNNDGYDDIMLGACWKNSYQGEAYVIYGGEKSNMKNIDFSAASDPGTAGFVISTTVGGGGLGCSVSAGYFSNYEYSELLIGAPYENGNTGTVYLVYNEGPNNECPNNCDTCSESSSCDVCTVPYLLENGQCVENCPLKTFASNGACQSCIGNCDTCSDSSSCDVCTAPYLLENSRCVENCPLTKFPSSGACQSCPGNCDFCSDSTTCTGCSPSYLLYNGQCVGNCPSKTVPSNGACQSCPSHCDTCSSSASCDVCTAPRLLYNGQCVGNCPSKTVPSNGACQSCPGNCDTCSDSTTCKACSSPYLLYNGQCVGNCPSKTFAFNGACQSCPDNCDTCSSATICTACSSPYLSYRGRCMGSCPAKTFTSIGACDDCSPGCFQCTSSSDCQICVDSFILTGSQCVKNITETQMGREIVEKSGEKAAQSTFESTSIVGASLGFAGSLPMNFDVATKILKNLKYMKLSVSRELQKTFVSWKMPSGFLKAPESWSAKYNPGVIPEVLSRYGLQSAFLVNFWKPLVLSLIGIAVFAVFKLIELSMKKGLAYTVVRKVNIAASNFALVEFYGNLDDVIFYFVLEMRSTKFETGFRIASTVVAILLFLVGGIFLVLHSKFLGKYQKAREPNPLQPPERFIVQFANLSLIFGDFKDHSYFIQSFLMINVIRSVISSLTYATLFEYPLFQISLLLTLNVLMIVYLCWKRPFKERLNNVCQVFCEVLLLVAHICVFILAFSEHIGSDPIVSTEVLCKGIIIVNFALLFGCALLLIANLGKFMLKAYLARRKNRQVFPVENKISASSNIGSGLDQSSYLGVLSESSMVNQSQTILQTDLSCSPLKIRPTENGNLHKDSNLTENSFVLNQTEIFNPFSGLDISNSNIEDLDQSNEFSNNVTPHSPKFGEVPLSRTNQRSRMKDTMKNKSNKSRGAIFHPQEPATLIQDMYVTNFES